MDLIEVKQASKCGDLPFSIHTAYKWHSKKKYPNLLIKVAGKLFMDKNEWLHMAQESRNKQTRESERLRNCEVI